MYSKSLIVTGLASAASAHILMTNPVPYNAASLDNSPLEPDGSNFPCKVVAGGGYEAGGASNVYAQGSTQQLEFQGTAVHGGGSCQVSVTTDLEPDTNSVWKVIKSIEGGCPAKDQEGNLPGDNAGAKVPYSYDFTIPDELSAGNYTIAWTWNNKIGNREMYMNCAPLTVTGGAGDSGLLDSLPDMFVANVGNGCETEHGTDVEYPNPGNDVDRFNGQTEAFKGPTGSGCAAPSGGNGGGSGGGSNPAPTSAPSNDAPPSAQPTASSTQASIPGGVFITASEQPEATAPPAVPDVPETNPETPAPEEGSGDDGESDTPNPDEPEDDSGEAPEQDSPSGSFTVGDACSTEGEWNCVGGSSFQRCASGAWSTVMDLAAGVTCNGGKSSTLNMSVKKGKRNMRRSQRMRA